MSLEDKSSLSHIYRGVSGEISDMFGQLSGAGEQDKYSLLNKEGLTGFDITKGQEISKPPIRKSSRYNFKS